MIEPKTFYRELDALLATIRIEKTDGDLLPRVIQKLQNTFEETLQISEGRIYEQRGNEMVLVYPADQAEDNLWARIIPMSAEPVQLAIRHRSYIYNRRELNAVFYREELENPGESTAIWIHNQEKQWMLVFRLLPSWSREEISLFLNAVRTSINYRIFTELMEDRLEHAAEIQKSLLPKSKFELKGYDIYGFSQPAELVGGDFYDYFEYDEGNFGVAIGDASGHGIPAALLVRDVVVGLRMGLAQETRLVHTIKKLNTVIQRSTYSTNFVSMFIGDVESDGHVFYVNAGHPAPFLVTPKDVQECPATGITLGFLAEIPLSRSHIHMPPESTLVMYTDGIIERTSETGEQFGRKRLTKLVQKNKDRSPNDLANLIFKNVFDFGQRTAWDDDATLVILKRHKENE